MKRAMLKKILALALTLLAVPAAAQVITSGPYGSINYWGPSGQSINLVPGAAGTCLQSGGTGQPVSWGTCYQFPSIATNLFLGNVSGGNAAPTFVDVNAILNTVGYDIARPPSSYSIIYKSATAPNNNWQSLPPGAAGQILQTFGVNSPPAWVPAAAPALATICTTVGAVLYYDPSTSWSCLAPGSPGSLLQTNGAAAPTWSSSGAAAAGALTGTTLASNVVNSSLTSVGTLTSGVWNATAVGMSYGGTGVSLTPSAGGVVWTNGSTMQVLAGTATAGQMLQSGASVSPAWSTATWPATVSAAGQILNSTAPNVWGATATPTLGVAGTTVGQLAFANATSGVITLQPVTGALGSSVLTMPAVTDTLAGQTLANGGTGGSLTASAGGVVWSDASKFNILAGTATARLPLLSGNAATPVWGAFTLPSSVTSGGVACFTSTSAMGSSGALTGSGVVLAGGAGACPTATAAGTTGQLFLGVTSGSPQWGTMSQDCTIGNTGVITCTKTNNVALTALATTTPGTGVATALGVATNGAGGFPTYTAGTWTPAITASTTPGTPSYTAQVGTYEQIGRQVTVRFSVILSGWAGTPAGNVTITGLPLASANTANDVAVCHIGNYTVTGLTAGTIMSGDVQPNTSIVRILSVSATATALVTAAMTGVTPSIYGVCFYHT